MHTCSRGLEESPGTFFTCLLPTTSDPEVFYNGTQQNSQKRAGKRTVSQAPMIEEHPKSESILMTKESGLHSVLLM